MIHLSMIPFQIDIGEGTVLGMIINLYVLIKLELMSVQSDSTELPKVTLVTIRYNDYVLGGIA